MAIAQATRGASFNPGPLSRQIRGAKDGAVQQAVDRGAIEANHAGIGKAKTLERYEDHLASLLASTGGKVEHVLAAGALLMLACFAPFVLFKLVPFAEGAVSSAYNRQSAGGVAVQSVQLGGSMAMMRRTAYTNWAGGSQSGGGAGGGSASKDRPGRSVSGGGGASAGEAAGVSGGAAGAVALPVLAGIEVAKGTETAAGRLGGTGTAQASGDAGGGAKSSSGSPASSGNLSRYR